MLIGKVDFSTRKWRELYHPREKLWNQEKWRRRSKMSEDFELCTEKAGLTGG